jgi:hypothetical protein
MRYFVQHHGQQAGPFSIDQIRAGLADGTYQPSDPGWREGLADWQPLSGLLASSPPLPPALPVRAETSKLAVWSLVLALAGFVLAGLTAIPAVICGHLALKGIRKSNGRQTGEGMAIAGLICGYLLAVVFVIAILAGLTAPMVMRMKKAADQVDAIQNAKQLSLALAQFEGDYGGYPSDATAAMVADASNTEREAGTSANAYFRQIIRAGIIDTEVIFHSRAAGVHKPDNLIDGDRALEPGECGFAYVSNLEADDETARPLAMTPLIPGTTDFDYKPYNGKAVILWTDGSVRLLSIDRRSGQVLHEGRNLLDPDHPVWAGKPPVIALPE